MPLKRFLSTIVDCAPHFLFEVRALFVTYCYGMSVATEGSHISNHVSQKSRLTFYKHGSPRTSQHERPMTSMHSSRLLIETRWYNCISARHTVWWIGRVCFRKGNWPLKTSPQTRSYSASSIIVPFAHKHQITNNTIHKQVWNKHIDVCTQHPSWKKPVRIAWLIFQSPEGWSLGQPSICRIACGRCDPNQAYYFAISSRTLLSLLYLTFLGLCLFFK